MDLYDHGKQKYGTNDVLRSSVSCAWSGIAAEWRHHPSADLDPVLLTQTELGIATSCHKDAVVHRRGNGVSQSTKVAPGTIWTCPAGVREENISLREWHECFHIYLPSSRFLELSQVRGGAAVPAHHVRYLADLQDVLIRQIALTLMAELRAPTSSGRVLAESLAVALTARLVQAHAVGTIAGNDPGATGHGLDDLRLRRVLDYMAQHIQDEISIDDLAGVACLSSFHFIRMFRNRLGVPPSRYLSQMRLERAKVLLTKRDMPLSDVAVICRFSSQTNFTRAFRRATGMTPGHYRRTLR